VKYLLAAMLAAAAVCAGSAANAQTTTPGSAWTVYGNLGYTYLDIKLPSIAGLPAASTNISAVRVLGGVREKYFGFELQGNFGVSTGSVDTVSLKLNSEASIYAVAFLPVTPKADLFARVGYGHVNVNVSGAGGASSASDGAVPVGVGGQYMITSHDGVRLDYTHFFDTQESSVSFDEVSVSYVRRF
jgi:outer membrane immunogenic protein